MLNHQLNLFDSNKVDSTGEITFSDFLCFLVQVRTNQFVYKPPEKYTPKQQEIHDKIQSMKDNGMSYRQITKYLNQNNIPTHTGKRWGKTGNSVYSVLKRHKERIDRIAYRDKIYEPVWSKMKIVKEIN